MTPIEMVGQRGDDLIISVFSMNGTTVGLRFPNSNGWSLCAYYPTILGDPVQTADLKSYLTIDQFNAFVTGWLGCVPKTTRVSNADIESHMGSPLINSGIVLVEAYYNYPQMLKMPLFEQIGDPIPVFTYSLMPMASAMPTPTDIP
jgi:hypothetical protein